MKNYRLLLSGLMFILCSALTMIEAQGQNQLLRELAKEDQDSRSGKEIARTDEERGKIELSLIGQGELKTPEDKYNAALVLQHTPFTYCEKRLVSKSPDNYLLAHHLFQSAYAGGYKDARYLIAASIDRYLSMTQGYQKYGTNRITNQETGKDEWVPIDRKTPDSEAQNTACYRWPNSSSDSLNSHRRNRSKYA